MFNMQSSFKKKKKPVESACFCCLVPGTRELNPCGLDHAGMLQVTIYITFMLSLSHRAIFPLPQVSSLMIATPKTEREKERKTERRRERGRAKGKKRGKYFTTASIKVAHEYL